jgi:hypothetical protein
LPTFASVLLNWHFLPDSFHFVMIQLNDSNACTAAAVAKSEKHKTVNCTAVSATRLPGRDVDCLLVSRQSKPEGK